MKQNNGLKFPAINKLLEAPLHLSNLLTLDFAKRPSTPGSSPGIENREGIDKPPEEGQLLIRCIDYSESHFEETVYHDIDIFLQTEKPEASKYRWINIDGIHPYVINRLKEHFDLHTLAAEDALHVPQRPKIEDYEIAASSSSECSCCGTTSSPTNRSASSINARRSSLFKKCRAMYGTACGCE